MSYEWREETLEQLLQEGLTRSTTVSTPENIVMYSSDDFLFTNDEMQECNNFSSDTMEGVTYNIEQIVQEVRPTASPLSHMMRNYQGKRSNSSPPIFQQIQPFAISTPSPTDQQRMLQRQQRNSYHVNMGPPFGTSVQNVSPTIENQQLPPKSSSPAELELEALASSWHSQQQQQQKLPVQIQSKELRFHKVSPDVPIVHRLPTRHSYDPITSQAAHVTEEHNSRRNSSPPVEVFLNTQGIKKKRKGSGSGSPVNVGEERRHSISYTPLEKYRNRVKKQHGSSVCFENNEFDAFSAGTHESQQSSKAKEEARRMKFTIVQFSTE